MTDEQIKEIILRELPKIMEQDSEVRELILRLGAGRFADKQETESRFDRLLDELRRDREEESRRWQENQRKWEDNQQAIRQMQQDIEQNQQAIRQAQQGIERNQQAIEEMVKSVQTLSRRHDSTIGALGARWGLRSERSFRNALKGILKDFFDIQVVNVVELDERGEVFGRPDQVELDIVIKDDLLIICEIKSSMSKADMYTFERKVRFYEKRHDRKATRLLVISPMVDGKAQTVAEQLGIQVYSYAEDVDPATFA
jgi:hypothetical protein